MLILVFVAKDKLIRYMQYYVAVRLKTDRSKKSTFSDWLLMSFFWKPMSKLVISQSFRKLGHFLTDWHIIKVRVSCTYSHILKIWPFSLKTVPFFLFLSKTNNSNVYFRAFFMLYTNLKTKFEKKLFCP